MEEKDCWNQFAVSGKVEDYLKYRSIVEYAEHNKADTTKASPVFPVKTEFYYTSRDTAACSGKTG